MSKKSKYIINKIVNDAIDYFESEKLVEHLAQVYLKLIEESIYDELSLHWPKPYLFGNPPKISEKVLIKAVKKAYAKFSTVKIEDRQWKAARKHLKAK